MSVHQRREFLALGGAWALSRASLTIAEPAQPARSEPAKVLPKRWLEAPRIALWPGDPPGAGDFAPQALPVDGSPLFVRNVGKPESGDHHGEAAGARGVAQAIARGLTNR